MRSTRAIPLVMLSLGVAVSAARPAGAQRGDHVDTQKVSPVQVVTREDLGRAGITEIGVLIRELPKPIDEVRINLPTDKPASGGFLPEGWNVQQRGKQLRLSGPALDRGRFRFDVAKANLSDFANKSTTVEVYSGGTDAGKYRSVFEAIDALDVTPNLEGIFTAPPYGTPGRPMTIGIGESYRNGAWRFKLQDGSTWPIVDPLEGRAFRELGKIDAQFLERLLAAPAPRPFVTIFPDRPIAGVTYTDEWGDRLVDAVIKIDAVAPEASCQARLTGGAQYAFAGQAACVGGCFPDYGATYDLQLSSSVKLSPWGYSPTSLMLGIPADTKPGPYTIGGNGISGTVQVGVLSLEGNIDTNSLWKGQSTTMRLRILGTDQPLPIVVLNRTPGIINVEGGVHQTITTPGGADNAITRSVRGIHRGNFQITYSLSTPGCGARPGS